MVWSGPDLPESRRGTEKAEAAKRAMQSYSTPKPGTRSTVILDKKFDPVAAWMTAGVVGAVLMGMGIIVFVGFSIEYRWWFPGLVAGVLLILAILSLITVGMYYDFKTKLRNKQ